MSTASFQTLKSEVQYVKGVGPKVAKVLEKLEIYTIQDLLFHLPRRYEDRRNIPPIKFIRPGEFTTVQGKLLDIKTSTTRGKMKITRAVLADQTGTILLTWFQQPWLQSKLEKIEGEVIVYGQVKEGSHGCEMATPEWEPIEEGDDSDEFARIIPVYGLTEGITQKHLRRIIKGVLQRFLSEISDPLPEEIQRGNQLLPLKKSLQQIHWPDSEELRLGARKRLVFDEFFMMQLGLQFQRSKSANEIGISFDIPFKNPFKLSDKINKDLFSESLNIDEQVPYWEEIKKILPFELTKAQKRVIQEILADMKLSAPMNRLLQGDVGSGKTAVAACAMLAAVRCGYQSALMVPTEILVQQHYYSLAKLFEPIGLRVNLLTGKMRASARRKVLESTQLGLSHITIGTHALIQEEVQFSKLGLVVIDEQHRFGVLQRAALRGKSAQLPDVLVMTATPIPRTLTMTLYGDLDLSVIDELPPGRKPVQTYWKRPSERKLVYSGVRKFISEGRQAYFVCPMISESEKMQTQAAEDLYYRLSQDEFSDLRVGLLHGQMKSIEKETVMEAFRQQEIDILVSTVVIEVGVDVPNASVMVIEDANRFGLSQLHQLRGRVGRGIYQSYCILIANGNTEEARQRLEVMVKTTDGFKIAEEDLKIRGPGEIAGTKQSGNLDFKLADLVQDSQMLEVARQAAMKLLEKDPDLVLPAHADLRSRINLFFNEKALITVS